MQSGSVKSKKSDVTRERIYHAAMDVMGERGYQGATIREICDRADVAVGSFYRYFPTKSDLFRGVFAFGDSLMQEESPELHGAPWMTRISAFIRKYAGLNADTGLTTLRILYNPENRWFAHTRTMQRRMEELIAGAQAAGELKSSPSAETITELLFICMRGICYDWCIADGAYDLEERMPEQMELILSAFRCETEE